MLQVIHQILPIAFLAMIAIPSVEAQTLSGKNDACLDPVTNENRCAIPKPEISKENTQNRRRQQDKTNNARNNHKSFDLYVLPESAESIYSGKQRFMVVIDELDKDNGKYCNITINSVHTGEKQSLIFQLGGSNRIRIGQIDAMFTLKRVSYSCVFEIDAE